MTLQPEYREIIICVQGAVPADQHHPPHHVGGHHQYPSDTYPRPGTQSSHCCQVNINNDDSNDLHDMI